MNGLGLIGEATSKHRERDRLAVKRNRGVHRGARVLLGGRVRTAVEHAFLTVGLAEHQVTRCRKPREEMGDVGHDIVDVQTSHGSGHGLCYAAKNHVHGHVKFSGRSLTPNVSYWNVNRQSTGRR